MILSSTYLRSTNEPFQPLTIRLFCEANPTHPPDYFALISRSLYTAFPIPLVSPPLSAPPLVPYLSALTCHAHSYEQLALPLPAILIRIIFKFGSSYVVHQTVLLEVNHRSCLETYPRNPGAKSFTLTIQFSHFILFHRTIKLTHILLPLLPFTCRASHSRTTVSKGLSRVISSTPLSVDSRLVL